MNATIPKPSLMDCTCNFYGKDGKPYVVRCPACGRENYTAAVADGQCAFCGWTAERKTVKPNKRSV